MFEQVNIIYGEIVKKMTVMVGDFSQKRSYLRKIRSVIRLLKEMWEKLSVKSSEI